MVQPGACLGRGRTDSQLGDRGREPQTRALPSLPPSLAAALRQTRVWRRSGLADQATCLCWGRKLGQMGNDSPCQPPPPSCAAAPQSGPGSQAKPGPW